MVIVVYVVLYGYSCIRGIVSWYCYTFIVAIHPPTPLHPPPPLAPPPTQGVPPDLQRVVEQSLEMYTCRYELHSQVLPSGETSGAGSGGGNGTQPLPKSYNELATLIAVPGVSESMHEQGV